MNKHEWSRQQNKHSTHEYKTVHKLLRDWKQQNGITERCVVHHRDDNDEVKYYNGSHYELWGFNEDGTFEYGKYVVFMTLADHCSHHHKNAVSGYKGCNHTDEWRNMMSQRMAGRVITDEHRVKIGTSNKGKVRSEESKQKNRDAHIGVHLSETTKSKMSAAHKNRKQTDEHRKKVHNARLGTSILYTAYKDNGGTLKWNDFCHAVKNGEITFEMQPITVYTM